MHRVGAGAGLPWARGARAHRRRAQGRAGWCHRRLPPPAHSLRGSGGVLRSRKAPSLGRRWAPGLPRAGRPRARSRASVSAAVGGRGGVECRTQRGRGGGAGAGRGARGGSEPQGLGVLARLEPQVCDAGVLAVALGGGGHDGGGRGGLGQRGYGQPEGRRREHQVRRVRCQVRVQVRVCVRHAFQLQLCLDLGEHTWHS